MSIIALNRPNEHVFMLGNEAIARGALEAGVKFCTAYPGTPSTEIIASLASIAKERDLYVEWSVNEKVALEAAAAAAFSGLNAICAMKANGLNVASDFLLHLNMVGTEGGLLIVVCDDPSAHSSPNEQDSRIYAKLSKLPLIEPGTFQEAKDMSKWALIQSRRLGTPCLMRGVTRISHGRGNVKLGRLPKTDRKPYYDPTKRRLTQPVLVTHNWLEQRVLKWEKNFETSEFNVYMGPKNPKLLVLTSGTGWLYTQEALSLLSLENAVSILKLGTTWPLPYETLVQYMKSAGAILFVEEVDPFLEGNVKEIAADFASTIGIKQFYGKRSGHIPLVGELNTDLIISALSTILDITYKPKSKGYKRDLKQKATELVPQRSMGFCAGCPHRASFWIIKNALKRTKKDGFVAGDIGCYSLARGPAGYFLLQTNLGMGSGIGLANGFGKLDRFDFDQPVIAVCGDSTFFHAAMPALANAHHNQSRLILVILDNSATAMTGFQPHPGVTKNAMGVDVEPLSIEDICSALGAKVQVVDPHNIDSSITLLTDLIKDGNGPNVLIMRRECALLRSRHDKDRYEVKVTADLCIGCEICAKIFKCPGIVWNDEEQKAEIDEVSCTGCGLCAAICPQEAITKQEVCTNGSR